MRYRRLNPAFVLVLIVVAAGTAEVAVGQTAYQWLDERGKLVVSDRPPRDLAIPYEEVEMGTSKTPGRVWRSPGSEETQETAVTLEPDGEIDNPPFRKNPEVCASAQRNIEYLNTYPRIRMRNAAGELVYLTEEEKQAQREEARRLVRLNCE